VGRIRSDNRIDGLLLFGSFARDEADGNSDVDFLVLHRDRAPDDILDDLPSRASVTFYSSQRLAELSNSSPLFANHLAREGIVLQDRFGALSAALSKVEPITDSVADRLARNTASRCDIVLRDPSFGVSDRLSAAELFALSKQAALLAGARSGRYEFNRRRAFADLGESNRRLSSDVDNVLSLEPVWLSSRRASHNSSAPVSLTPEIVESVTRILAIVAGRR